MSPEEYAERLKGVPDDAVRAPLWEFRPEHRKAVIHERRRRFGVFEDEGVPNG